MLANHLAVGLLVFSFTYIAIVSEKLNRTVIAMFGAVLMVLLDVLSQEEALHHIDFNTIGLLIGMMIIVNVIKRTGLFQYMAIRTAKIAKGDPIKILIYFSIITAVASGLLDNVTTILLVVPVTLVIADTLEINPTPFVIAEILSANIGGAATLIGDPPNIMIGGATGLGFMDFLINLGPLMVVIFIITIIIIKFIFRKSLHVTKENKEKIMEFHAHKAIKDPVLVKKSLIVLTITIVGFALAEIFHVETASIAIFGASLLLLISKMEPEEIIEEVEWTTIFFFMGLFVLVGALVEIGVIEIMAAKMLEFTQGSLSVTMMLVLWMSAILSAFLDNIPYVATMIPLVEEMQTAATVDFSNVWWALAIGSCLGGNGTLIGASANVVARGILEKKGHEITFGGFMKIAFPLMIMSIVISTVYIMVLYL